MEDWQAVGHRKRGLESFRISGSDIHLTWRSAVYYTSVQSQLDLRFARAKIAHTWTISLLSPPEGPAEAPIIASLCRGTDSGRRAEDSGTEQQQIRARRRVRMAHNSDLATKPSQSDGIGVGVARAKKRRHEVGHASQADGSSIGAGAAETKGTPEPGSSEAGGTGAAPGNFVAAKGTSAHSEAEGTGFVDNIMCECT